MNKDNIDWKEFGKTLLWRFIVSHKNEDSLYDIMTEDCPERGIVKGEIGYWRISSFIYPGSYKTLTWKELAIELGLGEEFGLFWDGHVCKGCPEENDCHAFFKYDTDHERCNWWGENMANKK